MRQDFCRGEGTPSLTTRCFPLRACVPRRPPPPTRRHPLFDEKNNFQVCLCGFRQLKDEDVQLLLDSCSSLSVLSVADCTTLGSLILRSRQLKSLDVSRCIHISEMSLDMPGEQPQQQQQQHILL